MEDADREHGREYHTVDEVADRLNVATALIYREIRRGHLVARRIGGRVLRVAEVDLRRYLDATQAGVRE